MNTQYCNQSEKYRSFKAHHHSDSWEISLQIQGEMVVTIGENQYNVGENDIRVVPPGLSHSGRSEEDCADIFLVAKNLDFSDVLITHDYDGNIRKLMEILNKTRK